MTESRGEEPQPARVDPVGAEHYGSRLQSKDNQPLTSYLLRGIGKMVVSTLLQYLLALGFPTPAVPLGS